MDGELYAIGIVRKLVDPQTVSFSACCTSGFVKKRPFPKRSLVVKLDALDKVRPLAFGSYLIAFFVGVVATVTWQRYGVAAREMVAPTVPSAYQQQLAAMSLDIDAMRQNVHRMITSFAVGQSQMTRSINQLRVGQTGWQATSPLS
jgi:hypothetical protein